MSKVGDLWVSGSEEWIEQAGVLEGESPYFSHKHDIRASAQVDGASAACYNCATHAGRDTPGCNGSLQISRPRILYKPQTRWATLTKP